MEYTEQWYQSRVWLPLELLFETIDGAKSLRGESTSIASSERKNLKRAVLSTSKMQAKKMGTRVDMLVTANDLEYLYEEDKASDDDTKMIEEWHFKIGKEMKDILWALFRRCNFDQMKMKLKVFFDVCDFKLYVLNQSFLYSRVIFMPFYVIVTIVRLFFTLILVCRSVIIYQISHIPGFSLMVSKEKIFVFIFMY